MRSASNWIRNHPLTAFYLITFAITWGLGFSFIAVLKHDLYYLFPLVSIALCGPALAGITVSAVRNPKSKLGMNKKRWIVFFIALIACSVIFLLHNSLFNNSPLNPLMGVFALFMVAPPVAYLVSAVYSRNTAVGQTLSSFIDFRRAGIWSLIALLFVPGLALLSVLISNLLGKGTADPTGSFTLGAPLLGLITVKFLYQFFFYNSTGEEMGWSGFARPHLQARFSPLVTALIVALFWAPWHLFLWYAEGKPVTTWNYWLESAILHIPASIIITWLYNRGRGSILVAGIAHAAANTVFTFLPNLNWEIYNVTAVTATFLLVITARMWRRLPTDHPAAAKAAASDSQGTDLLLRSSH